MIHYVFGVMCLEVVPELEPSCDTIMFGGRGPRPPVTSAAISVIHLMVVRVVEWDGACPLGTHCAGGAACSPKLHNAGGVDSMSEACVEVATIMLKPLRAAGNLNAS